MAHKNVELRMHQFRVAGDQPASLAIAKEIVTAKLRNSRVMLRRNHPEAPATALEEIKRMTAMVEAADSFGTLLGIEGAGARVYFAHFGGMIKSGISAFDFRTRNRRPPKDPVNSVLSCCTRCLIRQAMGRRWRLGLIPI